MITGDHWGERTIPTSRWTPATASRATASSIRGSEWSTPTSTRERPPRAPGAAVPVFGVEQPLQRRPLLEGDADQRRPADQPVATLELGHQLRVGVAAAANAAQEGRD